MTAFVFCNVIGWTVLIASWVSPYFIQDKQKARLVGLILSALATGMFISNGIWIFTK